MRFTVRGGGRETVIDTSYEHSQRQSLAGWFWFYLGHCQVREERCSD